MIYAGVPSFFGLGLGDGHVPTFWPLRYLESQCLEIQLIVTYLNFDYTTYCSPLLLRSTGISR